MATGNTVWGIDVGQCALKAIKLRIAEAGKVEALAFDLIEHPKILSQPDADPDELIRGALEKFASRNDCQGDQFVIGVAGQQTFARFCKMPPVDQKKVPDLVRFEASQQIPFDMDDVVWDYQAFSAPDSPDLEVGIFAMRKDLIRKHLEFFTGVGISPTIVQTIPCALYNFSYFEHPATEVGSAHVLINVGAQNTDLVIVEPNSAWTRNIPLGGNSFTEAMVRSFKLSFAKAEALKRTAATSKYARQIFQAMRPVFAELVAEIQRSIGFYSSTHRDVELKRVWALGNAFRLPGLQKYLENNLTVSGGVVRVEKFNKLIPSPTINAPQFTENILTFAAAYGLALQGLGLTRINANLLPTELARVAVWNRKRPYFVAAAACLGLAALLPYTRSFLDRQALASTEAVEAQRFAEQVIAEAQRYRNEFAEVQTNTTEQERSIKQLLELCQENRLVPEIVALVHLAMPEPNPAFANVRTVSDLKRQIETTRIPRAQRRQLLIDSLKIEYVEDIDNFQLPALGTGGPGGPPVRPGPRFRPGADGTMMMGPHGFGDHGEEHTGRTKPGKTGGFHVHVSGRLLCGQTQPEAVGFLTDEFFPNLRKLAAEPGRGFHIPDEDPQDPSKRSIVRSVPQPLGGGARTTTVMPGLPGRAPTEEIRDPLTGQDMSTDWRVEFGFKVKLGEKPAAEERAEH